MEACAHDHEAVKADLALEKSQLERGKQQLQEQLREAEVELELQNSKYRELGTSGCLQVFSITRGFLTVD